MNTEFINRRQKLMENKEGPCTVCIFSGRAPMRSLDQAYYFSVDRNFFYLTGIDEENMILVLRKSYNGTVSESLYIETFDEVQAKWVGARMTAKEASSISGIKSIRDIENFDKELNGFVSGVRGLGKQTFYLDLWRHHKDQPDTPSHTLAKKLQSLYPAVAIDDIHGDMAALRIAKSQYELSIMAEAQERTKNAIIEVFNYAHPGVNECELEGIFNFALMKQGCRHTAFNTIIAGGGRATTLHYEDNNCPVEDGQLVLLDLGATAGNYCADISRTFPVNGKFTERQKEIYNTVLEAQRIVIKNAKPGLTMGDLNKMVIDYYETRLDDLGLRIDGKGVRDYYYHGVSHSLGLDTHDICTDRERVLKPGTVITVEPGMYIEAEGIGIRIENDIVITEDGCIDLSKDIPVTVEEIEAIMAK